MNKFDEQILVVNRETLFAEEAHAFNGFLNKDTEKFNAITEAFSHFEVKRRGDMEEDPSYKQLVSYAILVNEKNEVLMYERLTGGGEKRLHGNKSIGVGGHMNDIEDKVTVEEKLYENAYRELEEEVGLTTDALIDIQVLGLINDDSNEVGRVHIGVVFKVKVDSQHVVVKETDTLDIEWVLTNEFGSLDDYETWSALIIEDLYGS